MIIRFNLHILHINTPTEKCPQYSQKKWCPPFMQMIHHTLHQLIHTKEGKLLYQHISKKILTNLESFCSKWRIKLNAEKTWCLNFHINKENDNFPRLWLKGELLRYTKSFKLLGITFDPKLTYEKYTLDIAMHSKKS